ARSVSPRTADARGGARAASPPNPSAHPYLTHLDMSLCLGVAARADRLSGVVLQTPHYNVSVAKSMQQ
ncbi:unnamed protein product, partial [Urochloa humidicola]